MVFDCYSSNQLCLDESLHLFKLCVLTTFDLFYSFVDRPASRSKLSFSLFELSNLLIKLGFFLFEKGFYVFLLMSSVRITFVEAVWTQGFSAVFTVENFVKLVESANFFFPISFTLDHFFNFTRSSKVLV